MMPHSTLPGQIYRTILLVFLLFLGYGTAAMAEEGEIAFTLLYSNNVSGEVAPCGGWGSSQLGGLSGKAALLSNIAGSSAQPLLLVDAGDLLFNHKASARDHPGSLVTAACLVEAYLEMGYRGVGVSSIDLLAGDVFFQSTLAAGFPWLSANTRDQQGNPYFPGYRLVEMSGVTVALIGMSGRAPGENAFIDIVDWRQALTETLSEVAGRATMIVVLSSLDPTENEELSRTFPEVDLLISADRQLGNQLPRLHQNTLISQVMNRGQFLGRMDIIYRPGGSWPAAGGDLHSTATLEKRLTLIDRQILRAEQNRGKSLAAAQELDKLYSYQRTLTSQLEELHSNLADEPNPALHELQSTLLPIAPQSGKNQRIDALVGKALAGQ